MKIKPCPFCGGKAEIFQASSLDLGVGYGDHEPGIGCPVCHFAIYRKTQHETLAVWNTRKTAKENEKVLIDIEKLREIFEALSWEARETAMDAEDSGSLLDKICSEDIGGLLCWLGNILKENDV